MRRVCRSPAFGRPVAPEKQIRGEYPTVAQSLADARCLAQAAWSTPLTRRKAERMFKRMTRRLAASNYHTIVARRDLLRDLDLVIMPQACRRGKVKNWALACYDRSRNTIYLESHGFFGEPMRPLDPHRDHTHGTILHEIAHAMTPRYTDEHRGIMATGRGRPHGKEFLQNLGHVIGMWCETEGSKVCDYYCPDWRKIVAKAKPPWQAE